MTQYRGKQGSCGRREGEHNKGKGLPKQVNRAARRTLDECSKAAGAAPRIAAHANTTRLARKGLVGIRRVRLAIIPVLVSGFWNALRWARAPVHMLLHAVDVSSDKRTPAYIYMAYTCPAPCSTPLENKVEGGRPKQEGNRCSCRQVQHGASMSRVRPKKACVIRCMRHAPTLAFHPPPKDIPRGSMLSKGASLSGAGK